MVAREDHNGVAPETHPIEHVEHTAELGGTATLGTISSFGVDAQGELLLVSHSKGSILRIVGPSVPPAPTGLRIVP